MYSIAYSSFLYINWKIRTHTHVNILHQRIKKMCPYVMRKGIDFDPCDLKMTSWRTPFGISKLHSVFLFVTVADYYSRRDDTNSVLTECLCVNRCETYASWSRSVWTSGSETRKYSDYIILHCDCHAWFTTDLKKTTTSTKPFPWRTQFTLTIVCRGKTRVKWNSIDMRCWLEWIYLLTNYLCNVGTMFIFLQNREHSLLVYMLGYIFIYCWAFDKGGLLNICGKNFFS